MKKVYIVVEEYDPYVHESSPQMFIHAVCDSADWARQIRNQIAEEDAKEWDVHLNTYALQYWNSTLEVCGSDYYILERCLLSEGELIRCEEEGLEEE